MAFGIDDSRHSFAYLFFTTGYHHIFKKKEKQEESSLGGNGEGGASAVDDAAGVRVLSLWASRGIAIRAIHAGQRIWRDLIFASYIWP